MCLVALDAYTQQTQDSCTETVRIPIYKSCVDVRIDSACRILLQSRFTRYTFSQHEIRLDQIQWKCDGPSHLRAVCANSDNRIIFVLDVRDKVLHQKRFKYDDPFNHMRVSATYENGIKKLLRFLCKKSGWNKYNLTMMRQLRGQSRFFVNLRFVKFKFATIVVLETKSENFRSLR